MPAKSSSAIPRAPHALASITASSLSAPHTAGLNGVMASVRALARRALEPAQVERLHIDLYACRELLVRNAIQYAALQCLVAFASYPLLDYLGQLVGVTRLPAQGAECTVQ